MKIKHMRWLLSGLLLLWVALNLVFSEEPKTVGLSSEWADGRYTFSGGTDPAVLVFAVLLFAMYVALVQTEKFGTSKPVSGVFRRFIAFCIDMLYAIAVVAPILGVVPMIIEWRRSSIFEWTFQRATPAAGDTLQLLVLGPISVAALVVYHVIPLMRKRPTPGACIMGYSVVPDDGNTLTLKRAVLRTLLGFLAACAWYIAPFVGRDREQGKIWLDKVFSTRAVAAN